MNRGLHHLFGPELIMTLVVLVVYAVCARHPSGEGGDLRVLEKMVVLLPPLAVVLVFLTIFVPGATTWWWLGRAIAVSFVGVAVFTVRILQGFGPGAHGQDAAFIVAMILAVLAASVGTAVGGAMILVEERPAFAEWFRMRRVIGAVLTLLAAVPIGFVLFFVVTFGVAMAAGLWTSIRR